MSESLNRRNIQTLAASLQETRAELDVLKTQVSNLTQQVANLSVSLQAAQTMLAKEFSRRGSGQTTT